MSMMKKLREALGIGGRAHYASKAMEFVGDKLILDGKQVGMPEDFYRDQEDRAVLRGEEVSEPRYQRLQSRTEDFRRALIAGVGRFIPPLTVVFAVPVLIAGFVAIAAFGPDMSGGLEQQDEAPKKSWFSFGKKPADYSNEELVRLVKKIQTDGKTTKTLTDEDKAVIAEVNRRGL